MVTQVLHCLQPMEDHERNRGKELGTAEKPLCLTPANLCAICCCTKGTECNNTGGGEVSGVKWAEAELDKGGRKEF